MVFLQSQCTYRCVVLPDSTLTLSCSPTFGSQCTYRCVVLPDSTRMTDTPTTRKSQCTYRCVVLPDYAWFMLGQNPESLNAPTGAWCSLTV